MEELTEMEVIKINIKYNHTKWSPKVSLEFRAKFFQKAEKEAEDLGFSFRGEYDYEIIADVVYFYPIYKDNDEISVKGGLVKVTELPRDYI